MKRLWVVAATLSLAGLSAAAQAEENQPAQSITVAQAEATPSPAETSAAPTATPPAPTEPKAPATHEVVTSDPQLKLSGVLFAAYTYDMSQNPDGSSKGNPNSFDVTRAYLNVEPVWDDFFGRVTLDIYRDASTTTSGSISAKGSLSERLKYGYFGVKVMPNMSVIVGQQQTPWIDFEEGLYGYRVLNPIMVDQFGFLTSSDIGVSQKSTWLDGMIDTHFGVYNGEGYHAGENSKYKDVEGRVTVRLMKAGKQPGLRASVYYGYGLKGPKPDSTRARAIGMLSYQSDLFTAAAEYLAAADNAGGGVKTVNGQGESVFGFVNLPVSFWKFSGTRVVARLDNVDPNTDVDKDGLLRVIGGVAFLYTNSSQVVLDYQTVNPQSSALKPVQSLNAHWEMKF